MKVYLTGATGWIGSHVARELLRRGHEVHAHVRPGSNRYRLADIEPKLVLEHGSLYEVTCKPDIVIHLAWFTQPGKYLQSMENLECLDDSRQLLDNVNCRIVCAGTCFELAQSDGPLSETSPTDPTTLYASCKDALRTQVVKRPDSVWLRLFYQYGPYEDTQRVVPSIIRDQILFRRSRVTMGTKCVDYLYVEDVARAIVMVAESSLHGIVHVGAGVAYSLRSMVNILTSLGGHPELIDWGGYPEKISDPDIVIADNRKLQSTGWRALYDIDMGLRLAFDWWAERYGRKI